VALYDHRQETHQILAERYAELQLQKVPDILTGEEREQRRRALVAKFLSKPGVLCVSAIQEGDAQRRREDFAAVCCAIQNVQLAAWADGIGMQWTTSPVTTDHSTYELLGIDPARETIVGFLYYGYPAEVPTPKRRPIEDVVRRAP